MRRYGHKISFNNKSKYDSLRGPYALANNFLRRYLNFRDGILPSLIDSFLVVTIHHQFTIKLTRDNYLLWKAHIVPYLKGQHLYGYLDGTTPSPAWVITVKADGDTQALQNLEFQHWHLQDQMILNAIISSLSEKILAHVVKCTTSREVWQALEHMLTFQSRARTMQIHY